MKFKNLTRILCKKFFGLDYFENEKYFLEINRYEKIQKSRFRNDEVITVLYINFFFVDNK